MSKKNNKKSNKKKECTKEDIDLKLHENGVSERQEVNSEVKERQEPKTEENETQQSNEKGIDEGKLDSEKSVSKSSDIGENVDQESPSPTEVDSPVSSSKEVTSNAKVTNNELNSTVSTSPPKSKKRLTLLERLALAAKGKKQKSTTPTPTSSAGATPPANDPIGSKTEDNKSEVGSIAMSKDHIEINEEQTNENIPKQKLNPDKPLVESDIKKGELDKLKLENHELLEENKRLKAQAQVRPANNSKEVSRLTAQLASKDETIEQLMIEGQALSVKELKLNESIKKLRTSNFDLEKSLEDYAKKNEEILLQFNEQEDYLKKHKFKSIKQLIESYNDISKKLAQANEDLETERKQDFEGKYNEQLKLFEAEALDKKQSLKRLNELSIQLEMSRKQSSLELDSKNTIISDLKKDMNRIRDENAQEIYRLENKVESLRMENERSIGASNKATTDKKDEENSVSDSKQIDYEEYAKLSSNHHNLQQQYLSSQENWKLIESNLLNKVDTLTSSVESLKKSKTKLTNDILKLQTSLQRKIEEYNKLSDSFDELKNEKEEIVFQNQIKETDYQELQEKFDKFQQIYNTDRQNLNTKIKQLTESLEKAKSNTQSDVLLNNSTPNRPNVNGLHINLEPPKFTKNLSFTSANESNVSYNNSGWQDIRFGESSNTPAISRDYSAVFMNQSHNNSLNSLMEPGEIGNDTATDSFSFNSKFPSNAGNGSISGVIPTGNNNIQLINKMSSNIRRLEIELNTLRDENTQLSVDKEKSQQEILKLFKLSEEISKLNKQIELLHAEIDEKSKKEETMLELIGEKSERVEELRADVQDLKELCRSQVQQMIEIQESK